MSEIEQGLQLSVMGILITFASLGLLIVVMIVLRELFNPKKKRISTDSEKKEAQVDQRTEQDSARARAAGIAVSVAYLNSHRKRGANLGQLLESPPGRWWSGSKKEPK